MTDEWYVILNMNCKYEICRGCPKSGLFKGSLKECDDWIKQKQKDEIKDKISMALKDPVLQQGFEILCKENAELKGEAVKWHKVADGDLPKENKLYLVEIKDNGLAIAYFNGRHWETRYNLGDSGHCVETVIAWCEIPKFEE